MTLPLQSESIDKLTSAFIQASIEIEGFKGDKKGNYGPYITINEIRRVAHKTLLKHGISYKQGRTYVDGQVLLFTKITHTSGQWECSYVPLQLPQSLKKSIDQSWGEAMSYQRRYELYALFGILGEDNDPDNEEEFISDKQLALLRFKLKDQPGRESKICSHYKIVDLAHLPKSYMSEVLEILENKG